MKSYFAILFVLTTGAHAAQLKLTRLPTTCPADTVEFHGLAAGPFNPTFWQKNTLNLVADIRSPLLPPRPGPHRNIYAPSIVHLKDHYQIFFGGWDGVPTANDRIYSVETDDFLSFTNRHTVIEHGPFTHVCNVSAITDDEEQITLAATAYPDTKGLNKPVLYHLPATTPIQLKPSDIVTIQGYANYAAADINGMNVLLRDGNHLYLYFNNFKDFGQTYRASQIGPKRFRFDGAVCQGAYMVNDVKKLRAEKKTFYLMALHHNSDELLVSLSTNPKQFPPPHQLLKNLSDADHFIVAVGVVVSDNTVQGLLYGAGAAGSLDQNRIFARWLQKKLVFNGKITAAGAYGPDRQRFVNLPTTHGKLTLYAEDGLSPLATSEELSLEPGCAYGVSLSN